MPTPPARRPLPESPGPRVPASSSPRPDILSYARPPARDDTFLRLLVVIGCTVLTAALIVPVFAKVRMKGYPVRPMISTTAPATTSPSAPAVANTQPTDSPDRSGPAATR